MPSTHLYLFSDACPTDWLERGKDDRWHTIVNFVFQSDPSLQSQIDNGKTHIEILEQDKLFMGFIDDLQSKLPSCKLNKWNTGPGYKDRFCQSFSSVLSGHKPLISACSFQEKVLRASKEVLIRSYNNHIGGIEGRGIGFEEYCDSKGRSRMKHSFVEFNGYHEINASEEQTLVLLLMSWFIADQYKFYRKDIVESGSYGFDALEMTVVSDKLSGDNQLNSPSEKKLKMLIDSSNENVPIKLTRSPESDSHSGDLLADNLAGWLNSTIIDSNGKHAQYAKNIIASGIWNGWHILEESQVNDSTLCGIKAIPQIFGV